MINNKNSQKDSDTKGGQESVLNRRLFLRSAGVATAVGTLALGACKDDDDDMVTPPDNDCRPGQKMMLVSLTMPMHWNNWKQHFTSKL
jgi:hypothetical protein